MIVVFGGSGYLGNELCKYFSKKNKLLIGTYYGSQKKNLKYFDLENPNLDTLGIKLSKVKYALISAGISKIDDCKKDERKAYEINVRGTKNLIEQLFDLKIIPVFFSSENVFNGEKGNYTELDKTNPSNVYGTHKKIIEDFLKKSDEEYLIIRLSRVFGVTPKDGTLLTSVAEKLMNNETIYSATDQISSILYIEDLVRVLDIALEKNLRGLYNFGSPEPFGRYEITKMVKKHLGISSGKIIPCIINSLGFPDLRPLNTSFDLKKLIQDTGFEFTPMEECLNKLKENYRI